jgi:hypothetical protein
VEVLLLDVGLWLRPQLRPLVLPPAGFVCGRRRRFVTRVTALPVRDHAPAGDVITTGLMRGMISSQSLFGPIELGGGALRGGEDLRSRGGRPYGGGLRVLFGPVRVDGGQRAQDLRIETRRETMQLGERRVRAPADGVVEVLKILAASKPIAELGDIVGQRRLRG